MQKLPSSCTFSVTQTSLNKQSQNSMGTKRLHINLLSLYRLQFFVFLDVDYKELVDESTRLYSKYEDPKELNDKEKKRLKNLTFISWRASLICQYKFEIFKAQYIKIYIYIRTVSSLILVLAITCVRLLNSVRFSYIIMHQQVLGHLSQPWRSLQMERELIAIFLYQKLCGSNIEPAMPI